MTETSAQQEKFKLYSIGQLSAFPKPEWLIEHVIERGALGVLYGATKSGKSFLALDWALSIASGLAWRDRSVKPGSVVYVVGEGVSGTPKRIATWMKAHSVTEIQQAFFMIEAPQVVHDGELAALVDAFDKADLKPSLIVFDTLARCFVGKDENSAAEMGKLIDGCRWLQAKTDATILMLHHAGKSGDSERGSSALAAGADVMISMKRDGKRLKVENTKQKNAAEFTACAFRLNPVVSNGDGSEPSLDDSCVLVPCDSPVPATGSPLGSVPKEALTALSDIEPASSGAWRLALSELLGGTLSPKTFDNWRTKLLATDLVEAVGKRYQLTAHGEQLVFQHTPSITSATQVGA